MSSSKPEESSTSSRGHKSHTSSRSHQSHKTRPPVQAKNKISWKLTPKKYKKLKRDSPIHPPISKRIGSSESWPHYHTMQLRSWFCFELVGDSQRFAVSGSRSLRGNQFEARIDKLYLDEKWIIHVSMVKIKNHTLYNNTSNHFQKTPITSHTTRSRGPFSSDQVAISSHTKDMERQRIFRSPFITLHHPKLFSCQRRAWGTCCLFLSSKNVFFFIQTYYCFCRSRSPENSLTLVWQFGDLVVSW